MDVTGDRFQIEIIDILQRIADSHFIAFDLEFSGVAGRRRGPGGVSTGKLTLQEYYHDIKAAAEKYQTLQVGLTIVIEDVQAGQYVAYPYNFNINPLPALRERQFGREWSFHSGAVHFLLKNGFRFDLPLTSGIPYLSRGEEEQARQNIIELDEIRSKLADMEIKEEDHILIDHIREEVDKWQAQAKDIQEPFLNIPNTEAGSEVPPSLNRYQLRLTHQIVKNEYPKLKTLGCGHFIQITNPTPEQITSEKTFKDVQREKDISKAIGFRWIMEAIVGGDLSNIPNGWLHGLQAESSSAPGLDIIERWSQLQVRLKNRRRILVGHNCFTDLVNLYKCFFDTLPDTVEEFACSIHKLFPGMIDTKHMASFGNKRWGNTSLEDVEMELRSESEPKITIPGDFDRYQSDSSYHEAGYDSLLTAKIAIKLSAKMEREAAYREKLPDKLDEGFNFGGHLDFTALSQPNESSSENVQNETNINSLMSTLAKPVEVLKTMISGTGEVSSDNLLGEVQANNLTSKEAEREAQSGSTEGKSTVFAVKERQGSNAGRWSEKTEIEKLKGKLEATNMYEALERDASGDLTQPWSYKERRKNRFKTDKDIEKMVKKGSLMPRWEKDGAFWQLFGNKLQVNGSREGVCLLS